MVDNMILTRIKRGVHRTVVRLRNSTLLTSPRVSSSFRRASRNAGLSFLAGTTAFLPLSSKAVAAEPSEPPSTAQASPLSGVAAEASAAVSLQNNALTVVVAHLDATSFTVTQSREAQAEAARAAAKAEDDRLWQQQVAKAAAAEAARQQAILAAQQAAAQAAAAQQAPATVTAAAVQAQSGSDLRSIVRDMVVARFGADQWPAFDAIVSHESGWNPSAYNPSGAYGIMQSLPGSKMASAGADWKTNGITQAQWGLGYITDRYGTPANAERFREAHGWY